MEIYHLQSECDRLASLERQILRRIDSWDPKDDELLAELVLGAIREGRTQLGAFQKAAVHLQRTPGACGFRWNGRLRKNYRHEVDDAKRERRTHKETLTRTQPVRVDSSFAMKDTVQFLTGIAREYAGLRDRVQTLTVQRDQLRTRVDELEQNLKTRDLEIPPTPEQVQQDAQLLAQIAIRARRVLGDR